MWDTKDKDSEVLTIRKDWIYYRVFDEIRKVFLNREKKEINWDTEEIVIKDRDRIPYVHHIFWAPKSELIEEWITPMPSNR